VLVGALALLLAVGATAVALLTTGGSEKADVELLPFVNRVENVLQQSASGRTEISAALQAGLDCEITPAEAARRIDSVAVNRKAILSS